jgi:hypothetical protein
MNYDLRNQLGVTGLRDLNRCKGLAEVACILSNR